MLRLFASASVFVIVVAGLPATARSYTDSASKPLRVAQNLSPTHRGAEGSEIDGLPKAGERTETQRSKRKAFLKDCIKK